MVANVDHPATLENKDTISFTKMLKVVFEEKHDYRELQDDDEDGWLWNGVDFCCPPTQKARGRESSPADKQKKKKAIKENRRHPFPSLCRVLNGSNCDKPLYKAHRI